MPAPLPPGRQPAKMRSTRVPDPTWNRAKERADREGRYMAEVIVKLLDAYGHGQVDLGNGTPPGPATPPPAKQPRKTATAAAKTPRRRKPPAD